MKKCGSLLLIVVFMLLANTARLYASSVTGEGIIMGRLYDIDNQPIEGARVELSGPMLLHKKVVYSDKHGVYSFPLLSPSYYRLSIEALGYMTLVFPEVPVLPWSRLIWNVLMESNGDPIFPRFPIYFDFSSTGGGLILFSDSTGKGSFIEVK
jgi:hypothetical protein